MKTSLTKLFIIPLLFTQLLGCTEERTTIDTGASLERQPTQATYYHGSPFKLSGLVPVSYTKKDAEGNVTYESRVTRAFLDKRIALLYTYNNVPGFQVGVNLVNYTAPNEPITFTFIGGRTKNEAFSKLFGSDNDGIKSRGYIYTISSSYFHKDPGLGEMEVVSHESIGKFREEIINKRKMLNDYIRKGLIEVHWLPGAE